MNTKILIEMFGYLGSALVVVSMLMTSVVRLRVINLIGSVIFAIYALIIKSYPTAVMNFFLVGINVYHLMRLRGSDKHYELLKINPDDSYVGFILKYYKDDIKQYFPAYEADLAGCDAGFSVCCDSETAGLLLGKKTAGNELEIVLDYSTPVYRDCSVGKFIYDKLPGYGIKSLVYRGTNEQHVAYVKEMGFTSEGSGVYRKKL